MTGVADGENDGDYRLMDRGDEKKVMSSCEGGVQDLTGRDSVSGK